MPAQDLGDHKAAWYWHAHWPTLNPISPADSVNKRGPFRFYSCLAELECGEKGQKERNWSKGVRREV